MADEGADFEQTLRETEVVVIGFGWLQERLLIDARQNEQEGAYIRVVQPVRSPKDRILELRRLRSSFEDPQSFAFVPWPGRVDSFVEMGLFDRILERCSGDETAESDARAALGRLFELDREDLRQAISGGEKYHTLFERTC